MGAHIKNLYMRDRKKKNFLVVADEDRAIDMKTLNGRIGCDRLSFGSADRPVSTAKRQAVTTNPSIQRFHVNRAIFIRNDQKVFLLAVTHIEILDMRPHPYRHGTASNPLLSAMADDDALKN